MTSDPRKPCGAYLWREYVGIEPTVDVTRRPLDLKTQEDPSIPSMECAGALDMNTGAVTPE